MKKIIAIIGVACFTFGAAAQNYKFTSFLAGDIRNIQVTNTIPLTNVNSFKSVGTNVLGTVYTNNSGTLVSLSGGNKVVLRDAPLWTDRNGKAWGLDFWHTNTAVGSFQNTPAVVTVTTRADSGANAAVTIALAPVYGNNSEIEATEAGEIWTFSFTPTASTVQTWVTNAPLWRWPGAKALRALRVVNADTDASSGVYISGFGLSGFVQ